jgi:hypothetical protein
MELIKIYTSPSHNFVGHHNQEPGKAPMIELEEVECVAGQGLRGDRYFGWKDDFKGQVTFFAFEDYEWLCAKLSIFDRDLSVFRRNIITRHADLNALIGQEFDVQGVRFLGTEEAKPCYWMNTAFGEGALALLNGRGGLRARILSDGILRKSV